jgi:hypothetical protein
VSAGGAFVRPGLRSARAPRLIPNRKKNDGQESDRRVLPRSDAGAADDRLLAVVFDSEEIRVSRETAARILAALRGEAPRILRVETITGSVAYVRSDRIVSLLESTPAQRAATRRMWKMLDEERERDEDDSCDS